MHSLNFLLVLLVLRVAVVLLVLRVAVVSLEHTGELQLSEQEARRTLLFAGMTSREARHLSLADSTWSAVSGRISALSTIRDSLRLGEKKTA